ncbi:haloacid dehalogenase type II [Sessilibacter corallicola]|uniref:haloacid dehalogenase type II n=1 Tax=Sessilibacter corallicola TaxID=2904075 RepID=UPI001E3CE060|nr:haloacid dehalogenase type II [Sessilibacter corallicola]MCE2026835.1 haloacid dehalogenase type II [Sessilibacter corallicola]
MKTTLAFDVYGTLINTQGVLLELQNLIGDQALAFSNLWREKQLEYSFRKGLMESYQHFGICTQQALDYCDAFFNTQLTDQQKTALLSIYKVLPAFDDVITGLSRLSKEQFAVYAFSNGLQESVENLLVHAKIDQYFDGVVSVDDLKTFKPNPKVYEYFLSQTQSTAENTWLISSNNFDVLGALNSGFNTVWVNRTKKQILDPWGDQPTIIADDLSSLAELISGFKD